MTTATNNTQDFYDAVAEYYPLFYRDWSVQLEREGLGLRAIFRNNDVKRVLDAACGAGTQAVSLAQLGYDVVAADPSAGMLNKAQAIAKEYGVLDNIEFVRTDFDHLPDATVGPFDAIVCKGNALPHL
ncbi:MAG: class I SAM-dependent methyltransferase, partial [Anaerolineae bacterium]|nr:class I SAM-dependent methyltransferase [Anaerolineae bacterium]